MSIQCYSWLTGKCPASPAFYAGLAGHNIKGISLAHILLATACPGSLALWAGSFNWNKWGEGGKEGKVQFAILMNRTYNLCEFV